MTVIVLKQKQTYNAYQYKLNLIAKCKAKKNASRGHIAIPMGLNMYENWHFWHAFWTALDFEVREFDNIFNKEDVATLLEDDNFEEFLNPNSMTVFPNAKLEPSLKDAPVGEKFQFVRMGYYTRDSKNTSVFNRTAPLKSSFKPEK